MSAAGAEAVVAVPAVELAARDGGEEKLCRLGVAKPVDHLVREALGHGDGVVERDPEARLVDGEGVHEPFGRAGQVAQVRQVELVARGPRVRAAPAVRRRAHEAAPIAVMQHIVARRGLADNVLVVVDVLADLLDHRLPSPFRSLDP